MPAPRLTMNEETGDFDESDTSIRLIDSLAKRQEDEDDQDDVVPIQRTTLGFFLLCIKCLGIIFPDIGEPIPPIVSDKHQIMGVTSFIIWSIISHATIKYMIMIITANNHGEGGTFSLCALLLQQENVSVKVKRVVRAVAIIGGSLIIGQGAISPAVKISKAISIVGVYNNQQIPPEAILAITGIMVVIIYQLNRYGSDRMGLFIGPVVLLWFLYIFSTGVIGITHTPRILKSFNPLVSIKYLTQTVQKGSVSDALNVIGNSFVAVAGMETLYADMGDFGPKTVRCCWFFLVLPCLIVSYLGIGGQMILTDGKFYNQVNFSLLPDAGPAQNFFIAIAFIMLLLSSQRKFFHEISLTRPTVGGVFSTITQAIRLGLFPPVAIDKTSGFMSCVYLPQVNQILMVLCLSVVFGFHSDANGTITDIYGFAIALLMLTTSILFVLVVVYVWNQKRWLFLIPGVVFILFSDIILLVGTGGTLRNNNNATGWPAMAIAAFFSFVMFSWLIGRIELQRYLRKRQQIRFRTFDASDEEEDDLSIRKRSHHCTPLEVMLVTDGIQLESISRWEGMGVFVSTTLDGREQVPEVFAHYLTFSNSAPTIVVFLRLVNVKRPTVSEEKKLRMITHGRGCYTINAKPKVDEIIQLAQKYCYLPEHEKTKYFIHQETIKLYGFSWKWLALKAFSLMSDMFNFTMSTIKVSPADTMQVGVFREIHLGKAKHKRMSVFGEMIEYH
ncbi:potassium uptake protein [Planoprotostelium fungivorum]|uniref:Potassium uptake protein n=1 Tax=Planoprotostelium fungivorum TaxID=1890364 RepID=A0A2P6NU87_9EUKA|nr:potassium uptake protein [Planoprotostelium fungivorum]